MAVDHTAPIMAILGQFKNIDPALYERLLRHADQYTFDVTVAVTEVDSQGILQAQGRAQQARKWMQMLNEAKEPNIATP